MVCRLTYLNNSFIRGDFVLINYVNPNLTNLLNEMSVSTNLDHTRL